jgi:autonomous glycyl radical cofactor GrcA
VSLSDLFIQSILRKIDSPKLIGVGIVSSYAAMFNELIPEKQREVVNKTRQLIKEADYL